VHPMMSAPPSASQRSLPSTAGGAVERALASVSRRRAAGGLLHGTRCRALGFSPSVGWMLLLPCPRRQLRNLAGLPSPAPAPLVAACRLRCTASQPTLCARLSALPSCVSPSPHPLLPHPLPSARPPLPLPSPPPTWMQRYAASPADPQARLFNNPAFSVEGRPRGIDSSSMIR
jgi:hypothetical protein